VTRPTPPTLHGERVTLRPLVEADLDRIRAILAEPAVAQWWGLPGAGDPAADWASGDDETVAFVIEADGEVVGSIQYAEEEDPDYRHAGIDLFLDTDHQGLGLGRDAVRRLARYLFDERGHHRLIIDPAAANERAIRSYASVGFRPVGTMRRYERGPDGTFHDGLLMDLLRDELR
jgi:aminoglycoside 6'-N-acetyltransferase